MIGGRERPVCWLKKSRCLALSVAAGILSILCQRAVGTVATLDAIPFSLRLGERCRFIRLVFAKDPLAERGDLLLSPSGTGRDCSLAASGPAVPGGWPLRSLL